MAEWTPLPGWEQDRRERAAAWWMQGLLKEFDVDLEGENYKGTPERFVRYLMEHLDLTPSEAFQSFPTEYRGLVVADPIDATGMCPHHLLPVQYEITVGYMVDEKALGLSKLVRLARHIAKWPLLQEDLTEKIADTLDDVVPNHGSGVIISGRHSCMSIRGVRSSPVIRTSTMHGRFKTAPEVRAEFLQLAQT